MSVSPDCMTLRTDKTYRQSVHPKMSVNTENTADLSEKPGAKEVDGNINRMSPELIKERIKANLEHLNEQISTLTHLLNQLIQDNWAQVTQRQVSVPIVRRRDPS